MMTNDLEQFAEDTVKAAVKVGADEADIYIQSGRESEVTFRMGEIENIKEARSQGYGLRVFKNKRLGFCFSSDFSKSGMRLSAERAVNLAGEASTDEFNGLPGIENIKAHSDLDLFDSEVGNISTEWKIDACRQTEQAMMDHDDRVFNSEGSGFYDGETTTIFADSNGWQYDFKSSYCYLVCRPVARQEDKLQAAWWFSFKRHFSELDSPEEVGRTAAKRAVRMLGARTPKTGKVPVVFDNITGPSILGSLLAALNGDAVFKKASYLVGRLGQEIASPSVTIVDDAIMRRGLASAPFDGEGLPGDRREVISDGLLGSYLYDTYTARKAGTQSTANAQRGYDSLPSIGAFNFYLQEGEYSFDEIIRSVKNGLYLTNLMGFGANPVTGDYSLGASGIWIENGKLAYPVEGITVASNMLTMLKNIDMVGNDLKFLGPISSPTFRVAEMTVSGG
jgi:PmbA protein